MRGGEPKTNKILVLIAVAISAILIGAVIGYAAITIWSNPVDVTISEYVLTLSDPADGTVGDSITFSGVLTYGGVAVAGETVTLYKNDVSTGLTDTTDVAGAYSIVWIADVAGTYTFKTYVP